MQSVLSLKIRFEWPVQPFLVAISSLAMRDQLGTLYEDKHFAALFPKRGRPAEAPWQLALVCVFQFSELYRS